MQCHGGSSAAPEPGANIILVGNHNVGKSVIFGWLTGTYVTVANYPGTTVEITRGVARNDGHRAVIDTPGISSLHPISEDERITRDVVLTESTFAVLQIADAKNLRRALLITTQLSELNLPLVLALNMMDEAEARNIHIDSTKLSASLGIPVVTTAATKHVGLEKLADAIEHPARPAPLVRYDPALERAIESIAAELIGLGAEPRGLAIMFLAGETSFQTWIRDRVSDSVYASIVRARGETQKQFNIPLSTAIQNARNHWIDAEIREVYVSGGKQAKSFASGLERWSVHPIWGIPILLLVLFALYQFVGKFGAGTLVNFIEGTVFGQWINPVVADVVRGTIPFTLVQDLLVGKYGIITVALTYGLAIILPIVFTFFIAFGILEDSGYLPRLAVMANRAFQAMGLNGKAVLPMVLGLGCDTMATITTRMLETKKDRVMVTLLLALGVPCSAQLGVVLGMLAGLDSRATLIWVGVIVVVLLAVGWLASKVIPGSRSDFIVELPPLRVPTIHHLLVKTFARMEWYLREVLPLFILGTLILFTLDELNVLSAIVHAAAPLVVNGLGLPAIATEAFLIGFLRRDFGAAGLFMMAREGLLTPNQILVALVTITLFVPCIANFFVMIKERGMKTALAITAFIFPFAFLVGGLLNWVLK